MESRKVDPSHEEVWDDSMLIDSWNDALAEYKKYHTIHAKGGRLEDLQQSTKGSRPEDSESAQQQPDDVQLNETRIKEEPVIDGNDRSHADISPEPDTTQVPPIGLPSQAILGSVRDENLKKLLMSWYYAGYYTGLFEGQQQQQAQQQTQRPS